MQRFKNILVVCSENGVHEHVVRRAVELAKTNGAAITLADAIKPVSGDLGRLLESLPGLGDRRVDAEVLELHRTRLAEIGAAFRSEGIETTEAVLQGIPFVEIIRKVLRNGHDLVMKGATGALDDNPFTFGSLDFNLFRKCPCPVWILKEGGQDRYGRVLAAIDPDQGDTQRNALNSLIMDLGTSIADTNDSELHVVNAWHLEEEDALRHSGFLKIEDDQVDLLVAEKRRQNKRDIDRILEKHPDPDKRRRVHLLKGAASDRIPEFARQNHIDLIVMGTVGRTGIQGFFIGNTAEAILNQVHCSVLAVKPPGFESPVRLEDAAEWEPSPESAVPRTDERDANGETDTRSPALSNL